MVFGAAVTDDGRILGRNERGVGCRQFVEQLEFGGSVLRDDIFGERSIDGAG